jgi:4-hydroxyphenylpyruvate dioxygenase
MADLFDNPMGTDGFEFVEYTAPDPELLRTLFQRMGFPAVARHRRKNVTLHRQGDVNFIINAEPDGFGRPPTADGPPPARWHFESATQRGPSELAAERGATPVRNPVGPMELNISGYRGYRRQPDLLPGRPLRRFHDLRRGFVASAPAGGGRSAGLTAIDHLTHNVNRGNMDKWAGFYERLPNFREIRYFDIEGRKTGLLSRAMTSLRGCIQSRSTSRRTTSRRSRSTCASQGEGIQHIALATEEIRATVDVLLANGIEFQETPDSYYEGIPARVTGHREPVEELKKRGILIDGSADDGILLQIFTRNVIGPIFFEIIQRKGNQGFGEGNFRALFESIELDQERRGVI